MAQEKKKHKFIKEATKNAHGKFRAKAEKAGMSTLAFAHAHDEDKGVTGKQARLAETLMKLAHHNAHKAHKASASHKTIRQSFYGNKEK